MDDVSAARDAPEERELSTALARLVVERIAPEELVVFDETAEEYFDDPRKALGAGLRDEPLGFGLDLALLTPFALAVAGQVVQFITDLVAGAVKDEAKPVVASLLRRLLHRPAEASTNVPLTVEQSRRVHEIAVSEGRRLGLAEPTTALLGDAIVGALALAT
ncbi:hypothetical protein [Specibacter cremeus]|uniref:hypothetical protein n=1 Tax=Specibacter cremeus TaxID=1629051 RepID=UPI000F7B05DE|nr:hypothetical protein [Specibacter cremeus]